MKESGGAPSAAPGKKRLVQARLPFKLLGAAVPAAAPASVTPASTPPAARKRKLSARPDEPRPTKLCKENEEVLAQLVLISDDDSRDAAPPARPDNPYLRLVDTAIKKKLDKKAPKKRKSKNKQHGEKRKKNKEPDGSEKSPEDVDEMVIELNPECVLEEAVDTLSEKITMEQEKDNVVDTSAPATLPHEDLVTEELFALKKIKCKKDSANMLTATSSISPSKVQLMNKACPNSAENKASPLKKLIPPEKETPTSPIKDKNNLEEPSAEFPAKEQIIQKKSKTSQTNDDQVEEINSIDLTDGNKSKIDARVIDEEQDVYSDIEITDLHPDNSPPLSPTPSTPESKVTNDMRDSSLSGDNDASSCTVDKSPNPESENVTPKRRSVRKRNTEKASCDAKVSPHEISLPDITTPKQIKNQSMGASAENNEGASPTNKSLTPKQMQRKLESAKKREERDKDRQERERKRLQEKEERNKVRVEKEEQKRKEREEREEQKKKEREEKDEQRRKEKEEKDRQRELEKKEKEEKEDQKRKEREEKEEQRRKEKEARDEEKRKKQEALDEEKRHKELEKQEQEIKKKKAAAAFVNFFVPKQRTEQTESSTQSKNSMLSCFMVKSDMRLAPTVRNYLESEQKETLNGALESQDAPRKRLYLQCLREGSVKPGRCNKTWPLEEKDHDCVIVESEDELPPAVGGTGEFIMNTSTNRERLRPKLLSFHDNRRPPYWGTWRKKSTDIRPRRPFGTERKHIDYEVDSDDDWEDEGEGESIAGSIAGSTDENNEVDEYEVDNEFFVPHGYLSDEEATMDEDDVMSLSPETQKIKLKHLEDEFESEMKKPTEKLKPRLYGMLWENADSGQPANCVDSLWRYFGKMAMILNDPAALLVPAPESEESDKKKLKKKKSVAAGEESPKTSEKKRKSKPVKREIAEVKKNATEAMKNQPGINSFLTKIKS